MRAWLQGLVGPAGGLPNRPVQVTAEGDHYRLAVPIGVARAGKADPVILTATARPLDGGRWAFEGPALPSPSRFTIDMPTPPAPGKTALGPSIPVEYVMTVGTQDTRGTYDPSFATPSVMTSAFTDMQYSAKSTLTDQTTRIERSSGNTTLRPTGADRVGMIIDGTIEGYALRSKVADTEAVEVAAKKIRSSGEFTAVSRDRVSQIVPALARITGALMAGLPKASTKPGAVTPAVDPQLVKTVVQALQDFASEFKLDQTIDDMTMSYGGYNGTATQMRIGFGAKADGGLLQARMDLGLDGLALPDVPLGAMAELIPRKIALRPVLTGIPTRELLQVFAAANTAKDSGPPPEFMAMLRKGTVGAGLESFALDIGGASFAGMGKVVFTNPETMTGQAHVTATNFDALMQRANGIPELAGVLPVFVFAKGIGRNVENRLVWDITYRGNKLLVNGTDLSTMTGGASK